MNEGEREIHAYVYMLVAINKSINQCNQSTFSSRCWVIYSWDLPDQHSTTHNLFASVLSIRIGATRGLSEPKMALPWLFTLALYPVSHPQPRVNGAREVRAGYNGAKTDSFLMPSCALSVVISWLNTEKQKHS